MADTTTVSPDPPPTCANCHKTAELLQKPLSKCAKCTTRYCSTECQKNDWINNNHKAKCTPRKSRKSNPASNPTATSRHNPGFESMNILLGLENDDYLHKMPEKDVYSQLIDCFRLRAEDEVNFAGNIQGIYDGDDPRPLFKEFLDFAESREKILPRWWNNEKRALCEKMAVEDNWYNINSVVEKSDIMEHYKDNTMPMKLRILAEKIYGEGFM